VYVKRIVIVMVVLLAAEAAGDDPVMLFPIVKDGKWGYMDKTGRVVIEPKYQLAWDFHEGLACVGEKALRGFIDKTGKVVIEPKYGWAGYFREGFARVNVHKNRYGEHVEWYRATGGWRYIDKAGGKSRFGVTYGARPHDVSEGVVWAGKQYLGLDGKKIPFDGDEGSSFSEGLAAARKGVLWGYIDHTMKFVVQPEFAAARAFTDGLAAVARSDTPPPEKSYQYRKWLQKNPLKWGYIDRTGKVVIDCTFEDAWLFSEGLAPVRTGGKWGYVDKKGAMIVTPAYDYAWPFAEGKGRVLMGGKHGYVDKTGAMVIEARYDAAWEFSKGLARVGVGEKEGYIDHSGAYVWEPTE
jgi:hypothetical protein